MELKMRDAMERSTAHYVVGKFEDYKVGDSIPNTNWTFKGEGTPRQNQHGQRMAKVMCQVCETRGDDGGYYDFEWYRLQRGRVRSCSTCTKAGRAATTRIRDFLKHCEFIQQEDLAGYVRGLGNGWSVLDDLTVEKAVWFVAYEKHLKAYGDYQRTLASQAARMIVDETRDGCPVIGGGKYHVKTSVWAGWQLDSQIPSDVLRRQLERHGLDESIIQEAIAREEENSNPQKWVIKWSKYETDNDPWISKEIHPTELGNIARDTADILNTMGYNDHGLDWIDS